MAYDPKVDPVAANLQKKIDNASGGMASIYKQQLDHHQMQQQRSSEQSSMIEKIQADNERVKKAAMATWNQKPEGENK